MVSDLGIERQGTVWELAIKTMLGKLTVPADLSKRLVNTACPERARSLTNVLLFWKY